MAVQNEGRFWLRHDAAWRLAVRKDARGLPALLLDERGGEVQDLPEGERNLLTMVALIETWRRMAEAGSDAARLHVAARETVLALRTPVTGWRPLSGSGRSSALAIMAGPEWTRAPAQSRLGEAVGAALCGGVLGLGVAQGCGAFRCVADIALVNRMAPDLILAACLAGGSGVCANIEGVCNTTQDGLHATGVADVLLMALAVETVLPGLDEGRAAHGLAGVGPEILTAGLHGLANNIRHDAWMPDCTGVPGWARG